MGKQKPLVTSRHLAATVHINSDAESVGAQAQTLVSHAGKQETSWNCRLDKFYLAHEKQYNTPFLFPHPHLSVGTLKVSVSVCFCVLVEEKCESIQNSKGQLSSPMEKAYPYSPGDFYFYFLGEGEAIGTKSSYLEIHAVLGYQKVQLGGMPEQKF